MAKIKRTQEQREFDKVLGEKLMKARQDFISRTELAHRLNISYGQLYKYEKGESSITAFLIHKIKNILKYERGDLE